MSNICPYGKMFYTSVTLCSINLKLGFAVICVYRAYLKRFICSMPRISPCSHRQTRHGNHSWTPLQVNGQNENPAYCLGKFKHGVNNRNNTAQCEIVLIQSGERSIAVLNFRPYCLLNLASTAIGLHHIIMIMSFNTLQFQLYCSWGSSIRPWEIILYRFDNTKWVA